MRLILVPQLPVKLRYQEWWLEELPRHYSKYFDEVIVLAPSYSLSKNSEVMRRQFTSFDDAIDYELQQIKMYFDLPLKKDDVLLLCDISTPGFFSQALFYKRPAKAFAICHATSKNRFDYFSKVRRAKYPIERTVGEKIFDAVFVATPYHAEKLKWKNIVVVPFPLSDRFIRRAKAGGNIDLEDRQIEVLSVARACRQKVTRAFEKRLERELHIPITRIQSGGLSEWDDYFYHLKNSKRLLITTKEETYGYTALESLVFGCVPIAPNKFSYPFILPRGLLYNNYEELKMLVSIPIKELWSRIEPIDFQSITNTFYKVTSEVMSQ